MYPNESPSLMVSTRASHTRIASLFGAIAAAVALMAALAASPASAEPAAPTTDVINGTIVPNDPDEWPFAVALLSGNSDPYWDQFCGGSLISSKYVLTAAHCVDGITPTHVLVGQKALSGSGGEMIAVTNIQAHPQYNSTTMNADVAVLELAQSATTGSPITMASSATDPTAGQTVKVAGWGNRSTEDSDYPDDLYEASVDVVANSTCDSAYGVGSIFASNLCAAYFAGLNSRDTCQGDSGGPLVYDHPTEGLVLAGVTSWGNGCAEEPYPGVYARVSSFKSWVSGVIGRAVSISPNTVNVGSSAVGVPVSATAVVRSSGGEAVTVNSAAITAGSGFSIDSTTCTGAVLQPESTCLATVKFTPTAPGLQVGELTVNTNSTASPTKKITLYGFGTGQVKTDVALNLRMPKKSKSAKKRGKIRSELFISYQIPTGTNAAFACTGAMRMALKIPGQRKSFVKGATVMWSSSGCTAKFIYLLPKKAKGKRATVTVSFDGNAAVNPLTQVFKQRLR